MRVRIDRVKLIAEMARQEIGVAQLAALSGVSRASITSLRSGKSCSDKVAQKVAAALNTPLNSLTA